MHLKELGLNGERLEREVLKIREHHVVARLAQEAFEQGIPQDQGPVWFDGEEWKTFFWQRQWEWQRAYREGEKTRSEFGGRDENPYHQELPPFTSRLMELELSWNFGFDGKAL